MYTLNQKTQAEIDGEVQKTAMTVAEYNKKYKMEDYLWFCDSCKTLYDKNDTIIEHTFGGNHDAYCPTIKDLSFKHWFRMVPCYQKCNNLLYCDYVDSWKRNYHLIPIS